MWKWLNRWPAVKREGPLPRYFQVHHPVETRVIQELIALRAAASLTTFGVNLFPFIFPCPCLRAVKYLCTAVQLINVLCNLGEVIFLLFNWTSDTHREMIVLGEKCFSVYRIATLLTVKIIALCTAFLWFSAVQTLTSSELRTLSKTTLKMFKRHQKMYSRRKWQPSEAGAVIGLEVGLPDGQPWSPSSNSQQAASPSDFYAPFTLPI